MIAWIFLTGLVFIITTAVGFLFAPTLIRLLHIRKIWKPDTKKTLYGTEAVEFNKLRGEGKSPVPRLGGCLLLFPVLIVGSLTAFILNSKFIFLALLLFALATMVGIYDDLRDIGRIRGGTFSLTKRLIVVFLIGCLFGWATHTLIPTIIGIPGSSGIDLGLFIIPFVGLWFVAWYASGIIDGIDGLSSSVFFVAFFALAILSFIQGNPATLLLSTLMMGALLSFLWFNINPARVYLTESGMMPITLMFAYLTILNGVAGREGVWVGIIIGFVLLVTWLSVVVQLLYRKWKGTKLLRIAPLHHHFEAIGIPGASVVMYYTIVSTITAVLGLMLATVL